MIQTYFATFLARQFLPNITIEPVTIGNFAKNLSSHLCWKIPQVHDFLLPQLSQKNLKHGRDLNVSTIYDEGVLVIGLFALEKPLIFHLIDPRGANPPFGQDVELLLQQKEMVVFWSGTYFSIPPQDTEVIEIHLGLFNYSQKVKQKFKQEDPLSGCTNF